MSSSPTRPSSSASNNEKQKNGKPSLARKGTTSPPPFGSSRHGEDSRHAGQKPPPPQYHSAPPAPKTETPNGSGSVAANKNGKIKEHAGEVSHATTLPESERAFEVLPGAKVFFTSYANGAYKQLITIFCNEKQVGVFEGSGENVPMKVAGGHLLLEGVKQENPEVITLPISLNIRQFRVKFEHIGHNNERIASKTLTPVNIGKYDIIETISINSVESSGGDICDSQLKCDIMFPDLNNPTRIRIPKGYAASISSISNSKFEQRLTCRIDHGDIFTFSGMGQNKSMQLQGDEKTLKLARVGDKSLVTLMPEDKDRWLVGIFTYVEDGEQKLARVNTKLLVPNPDEFNDTSEFKSVTVSTEDHLTDNSADKNDTILRVVAIRGPVYRNLGDLNVRPHC